MEAIYNNKSDNAFRSIVASIFIIIGLATLSIYLGYFFLLMALVIIFYRSGIEFDLENKTVRTFNSYFGLKKGHWKSLNEFYALTIKRTRKGYRTVNRSGTSSVDTLNTRFEVLLMGKKATDTIVLFDSKVKDDSLIFMHKWSNKIGLPVRTKGKN